jgi:hypothetical protein
MSWVKTDWPHLGPQPHRRSRDADDGVEDVVHGAPQRNAQAKKCGTAARDGAAAPTKARAASCSSWR